MREPGLSRLDASDTRRSAAGHERMNSLNECFMYGSMRVCECSYTYGKLNGVQKMHRMYTQQGLGRNWNNYKETSVYIG